MADRPEQPRTLEATGPWPFITRRLVRHADGSHAVWRAREHRKGLVPAEARPPGGLPRQLLRGLRRAGTLNWWIACLFAIGASLFAIGCLPVVAPPLATALGLDTAGANRVFFAGSIFFTTAAGLQLHQAGNAGAFGPEGAGGGAPPCRVLFGWRPQDAGWLSCALQFPGTLLFNVNTFAAMLPGLSPARQDLEVWVPDVVGSVLFLASGALAYAEVCHAWRGWRPASLSWWVAASNLAGCIAFMISAVFAFVPLAPGAADHVALATVFTFLGALGFLAGALLMLPENAPAPQPPAQR